MDLTPKQQRYMQTIFDYFHERADWPTRKYLERELLKADLDAREIAKTLASRIGDSPGMISWNPDSQATLTVPDMTLCRGSEPELNAFIETLQLCVKRYLEEDQPTVSNLNLITTLNMQDVMACKVGLMFQVEPSLFTSYSSDAMGWTMGISSEVFRFRKVQTLEDYLAARWKPPQPTHAFGLPISGMANEQAGRGPLADTEPSRDVFIVHGHDEAAKEAVARFIDQLGLHAVILHEQPNAGRTIIEKFEKHATVAFAAVLLTPDDIGASQDAPDAMKPRARQNVVLELGYFLGALGRDHVCALHKGSVELPSDIQGVLYVPMDERGAWKADLKREIKAAGLEITGDTQ